MGGSDGGRQERCERTESDNATTNYTLPGQTSQLAEATKARGKWISIHQPLDNVLQY